MKKFLKIIGVIIVAVLLLLTVLPYFFKDKIVTLVKEEGNKLLNAEFDFSSLDISLIRKFPSASIALEDFYLKGVGEFENDTLAKIGRFSVSVNMFSIFSDEGFDISEIELDEASLNAIVLPDGAVNWDIMKSDESQVAQVAEDTLSQQSAAESSQLRIKLKEFSLNNFNLVYDDRQGNIYAKISEMNATCSGDFGSARTLVTLKTDIAALSCKMDGIPYLNNAELEADIDVDADIENNLYTLNKNSIRLNAIVAAINGWVAMKEDGIDMDISLNSNEIGFKEILSLIPAIYAKDFDGIKTDGNAVLRADAKGMLKGDSIVPNFNLLFDVKNAMFQYPGLPAGVENINISAKVANPGGAMDETTISVKPFNFVMAGNPFAMTAEILNPVSDMYFNVTANGKLDLGKVKDVYPLEDMQLGGVLNANLGVEGRMSYIEKEKYDKVNANGTLALSDMVLHLKDIPNVNIKNSLFTFTPRYLNLSKTTVLLGDNDVTFDSRFENYMGYIFKGTTLKGSLNVSSNKFNINDFMTGTDAAVADDDNANAGEPVDTATVAADTLQAGVIKVPDNIDFTMQTTFENVLFDNMKFQNMNGLLVVRNGKVDMKNLSLNTMGGSVVVNGFYSTENETAPEFNASFKLENVEFAKAYDDLNVVRVLAPIFSNLTGTFSGSVNVDTKLNDKMEPIVSTMNGGGKLSTNDLSLREVKIIQLVADIVKKPELKEAKAKDVNIEFAIENGRVSTKPFNIKLKDYNMRLSGTTGLDQTIDYKGEITIPQSVGNLSKLGTVDMLVTGTFKSPKVSIDMESLAKKAVTGAAESLLDKVLGDKKEESEGDGSTENSDSKSKTGKILNKALDLFKK